ncbi:Ger(x)C family spore germination protein [Hazenella coriacea]|uniref:Ger(X)C family germination protein n=1 Tax=Hazenella coriacea TaxID=1179467 RepID=A0A4R3L2K7_9BACL|nr:Ger(x)C family spore germination protein [Hazenella coriacea]TCS93078.1 Ger(x)C family germination protein [Hazenella coriacea]
MVRKHPLRRCSLWILCFVFLTGCWDQLNIEERTMAISLAIDKAEPPNRYEVTIQVPVATLITGGGGGESTGGGGAMQLFSSQARTVSEAISKISETTSSPFFFGHAQTILFSEEQARKGVGGVLDVLRRSPGVRRGILPVVHSGPAKKGLESETKLEQVPTVYLKDMIENNIRLGQYSETTLGKMMIDISNFDFRHPVLNYMSSMKNGYNWEGLAVFEKDQMLGVLERNESNILLHIREQKRGWNIVAPCTNAHNHVQFQPDRASRSIQFTKDRRIVVDVELEGTVIEKGCSLHLDDVKASRRVGQQVAQEYEKHAKSLLQKLQKEYQVDSLYLGNYLHAYYPQEWKKLNWKEDFPNIPVQINYHVIIRGTGVSAD